MSSRRHGDGFPIDEKIGGFHNRSLRGERSARGINYTLRDTKCEPFFFAKEKTARLFGKESRGKISVMQFQRKTRERHAMHERSLYITPSDWSFFFFGKPALWKSLRATRGLLPREYPGTRSADHANIHHGVTAVALISITPKRGSTSAARRYFSHPPCMRTCSGTL